MQPTSTGNEVCADPNLRLRGRKNTQQSTYASQPTDTSPAAPGTMKNAREGGELENDYEACKRELEEAREQVKAESRRIKEAGA